MVSRLQPDQTGSAAAQPRAAPRHRAGAGGLPGWRPLLAAIFVVLVLALVLHLLYR